MNKWLRGTIGILDSLEEQFDKSKVENNCLIYNWTCVPSQYFNSLYINCQSINPKVETIEEFSKRIYSPNTNVFHVIVKDEIVISSVISFEDSNHFGINLLHTNIKYRNNGYGKLVILSSIIYLLKKDLEKNICAVNITSSIISIMLENMGFKSHYGLCIS